MAMNGKMGGFGPPKGLMFLVVAYILLGVSMADKNASQSIDSHCAPKKIIVGGSQRWRFGFNYSQWATKKSPFYVNDTLIFKYAAPSATVFPHSVYLFPNRTSYLTCNLKKAKKLANPTEGAGSGFKFVLKKKKNYYFACGERGGIHCKAGGMKFLAKALSRKWY